MIIFNLGHDIINASNSLETPTTGSSDLPMKAIFLVKVGVLELKDGRLIFSIEDDNGTTTTINTFHYSYINRMRIWLINEITL